MNERIRLFAEQANVFHADFFDNELEVEQFAKLIVRECIKILADNSEFRGCVIIGKHFS